MRGAGYDDELAAQWLEAARKYERTARESTQAATAYAAGNVSEGKSLVVASWQTHESADRAANKARVAQLDAPSSSHEPEVPPAIISKEKEIVEFEPAFVQEKEGIVQELPSSKIDKADKKRIRASKKLKATALSYAAIWSQTASDYSVKEVAARSADNEKIAAQWFEASENSRKVAEEYTKAAQLYAEGKINEGAESWHDARFTSNAVKAAADSAVALQREEKIERSSDTAVIFPKTTSEYCLKLQQAEAANNSELIAKWREVAEKNQKASEVSQQAAEIWRAPKKGNKKWREQSRKKKGESADNIAQSMEKEANTAFKNSMVAEEKEKYGVQVEVGRIEEKTWIPNLKSSSKAGASSQKLSSASQAQVDPVDKSSKKKVNSAKKKTTAVPVAKTKKEKSST